MKLTEQNNTNRLNWLASLSAQDMNSLSIIKATKLVREINKHIGTLILLNDSGFILSLVDHSEKIQSEKLHAILDELIKELLKHYDSEQLVNSSDEIFPAKINMILQQLSLHSKVINHVTKAQSESFKVSANMSSQFDKTVLVVDDDTDLLPLITEILSTVGFQTLMASNGHEALDMIAKGKTPDLLLTDIQMPSINGFKLAGEVKKLRPNIGVVYMSAYQEYASNESIENVEVPATLLKKPFNVHGLSHALIEALPAA